MDSISEIEKPDPALAPFAGEFLADRQQEVKQIHGFLKEGQYDSIRALAHNWAGFSRPYGFGRLGFIAKELEVDADNKDETACTQKIQLVEKYLQSKAETLDL